MRKRFRQLGLSFGTLNPATKNLITDVPKVKVGHVTLFSDKPTIVRTGVTAIIPSEDVFQSPVTAAYSTLNGFGKSIGLLQIEELGQIETPIVLTNTLSVGYAFQGIVQYMGSRFKFRTLNPVVGECNDGFLNDILYPSVNQKHVIEAIESASENFELGSVGAGTGMICFGFKGGIGSSSRILKKDRILGVLVLANFGAFDDLHILGTKAADHIKTGILKRQTNGSIIIIVATNVALDSRQLKRLSRHSFLALGMLGAPGYHSSGDICIAFSTEKGYSEESIDFFDLLFRAVVECTYEAICDALFCAETTDGFLGKAQAMPTNWIRRLQS
ncbi:P1 family peptidase [Pseudothermotoga elfii]|uniref:P1 family peptidase n=1 Tax=Pseudothermotoga elfii TaxID=38322 RepID=UPI0004212526|nr:P1 family peptidase [Pseudothermotoga elfii]